MRENGWGRFEDPPSLGSYGVASEDEDENEDEFTGGKLLRWLVLRAQPRPGEKEMTINM
jgi:hypothetical protein